MTSTQVIATNPWNNKAGENAVKVEEDKEDFKDIVANIAKTELREDPATREQCLEQLREWIRQNPDIQDCLTDDNFLLRFLRVRKYSLPMAQQTLLKYLNMRKNFNYIFDKLDYLEPKVNELISNGYIFVSPFRDSHGRRVTITTASKLDAHKFTSTDMARAHAVTYETLLEDDENQILGITHTGNTTGGGMAHVTMWSVNEFAHLIKWGEQSYPMRHKEFHVLYIPAAFRYVYDFATSLISEKLRDRIWIHNSPEELHSKIDPCVLPREYGGVMPMAEMIDHWKKELEAKRERLLSFDNMNILSDKGIIRKRDKIQDDTGNGSLNGSFRKLEVD